MKTIQDLMKRFEVLESIKDNAEGTFCIAFDCAQEHEYNTLKSQLAMWENLQGSIEWRGRNYLYSEFDE